jgi:hypothetical protein
MFGRCEDQRWLVLAENCMLVGFDIIDVEPCTLAMTFRLHHEKRDNIFQSMFNMYGGGDGNVCD